MYIKYNSISKQKDEEFISLFALGIINALKCNLITIDDAWSWLINIRTLNFLEQNNFSKNVVDAIHLGTELENVKRIIPLSFNNSCDEIIDKLNYVILNSSSFENEIDCLIEFIR